MINGNIIKAIVIIMQIAIKKPFVILDFKKGED